MRLAKSRPQVCLTQEAHVLVKAHGGSAFPVISIQPTIQIDCKISGYDLMCLPEAQSWSNLTTA